MKKVLLFATISLELVTICTAVSYYDYRHESVSEIIELYNQREELALTEPENVKGLWGDASILISALENKGGKDFLPFFKEKSLSTNLPYWIRESATRAYLKHADLNERIKLEQASIGMETQRKIRLLMLEIALHVDNSGDANDADQYLCHDLPLYSNSVQRATLARFATGGSPWCTNTFNPIKDHFDALPKSELVDLREQFPELPPLPSEEERGMMWVYGVVMFALVSVATVLGLKYYKSHFQTNTTL